MKTINRFRGKFPPVEVENGYIYWEDKEPTPIPEEAHRQEVTKIHEKLDTPLTQQTKLMEEIGKLKEGKKPETGKKPFRNPPKLTLRPRKTQDHIDRPK